MPYFYWFFLRVYKIWYGFMMLCYNKIYAYNIKYDNKSCMIGNMIQYDIWYNTWHGLIWHDTILWHFTYFIWYDTIRCILYCRYDIVSYKSYDLWYIIQYIVLYIIYHMNGNNIYPTLHCEKIIFEAWKKKKILFQFFYSLCYLPFLRNWEI